MGKILQCGVENTLKSLRNRRGSDPNSICNTAIKEPKKERNPVSTELANQILD